MKTNQKTNGKVEILIAEDSPTQAKHLAHLLEQHGYSVTAAANGREALALLDRRKPTLVISDIVMPELDGYGLCRAIKADKKLKDTPVMLVTTLSDPQDVIRGLECGADNFVRKPYEERYLLSRIDYLLMNLELRKNQKMQMGMEIDLGGQKHFISSDRQQILDLLISTYEQAVEINSELKQREKELAHSNQVLNGLYRIADGLNHAASEREVVELALERAMELPGIQAGWISLREGESGFRLAAAHNLPPALEAPGAMEGDCTCRRRLVSGELDHVTNIMECERLGKATGDTRGLRYHASVPLWLGDRTLGVMNLVGPEKGLFNEDELKILYSVGNQVAVALERAHLHEHLERLVQERTAALEAEIVERKRIEKEQARLVAIIEATPDMIATSDLDGNVLYLNHAGLGMIGYDAGEGMAALRIAEAHLGWAAKLVAETGFPHAIEHGSWSGETALQRRGGGEIPLSQVIIAHRGNDGSVEYLSTIARDITESKRAEEEIRTLNADLERRVAERTLQLDRANRAKSSFLATMSHEIRTPLGGLIGMLELLSMSPLADEQRETLEAARDSARSLLRILNDVLDWSKIEEGKLELAPQATSLAGLAADVVNTYAHVASADSVTLVHQVDARLSPTLKVDPLRLSQILNNFVSNAIKFSKRGKQVELRVELIERREGAETVRFAVKDAGIGIDPQEQSRLFQNYGQASADTARMYGGTGLGLAICQRLAELMGGWIDVDSEPGRGSTFSFTITLPLARAGGVPRQNRPTTARAVPAWPLVHGAVAADAPLVLVVDDHPINRKLLARQLGLLGLRVETAPDGNEALPLWRAGRYALVITDCHMPGIDGYELAHAIRTIEADEARVRTPIFAWTANTLADEADKCEAAGMDELLVKPADLVQLKRMLEKWLPTAAQAAPDQPEAPPAPPAAAAPLPLDLTPLTVMCGGDSAAVRESLLEFRRTNDQDAVQLRQAVAQDDLERVVHATHRMLGSSGIVGAHDLARACKHINHASRAGDSETVAEGMQALESEVQRLNAYIDSLCAH